MAKKFNFSSFIQFKEYHKRSSSYIFLVGLIFLFGFVLRLYDIYPANVIVGFDQARDLFASKTIWTHGDIKIIGPTAGNNTDLHHGILWIYFILSPIIAFGGNPFWVSAWNSFFNAMAVIVLFFFAKSMFKSKKAGLISAFLTAISFYFIEYASWLSNPSPTLLTVPLFFFGIWEYSQKKNWGLVLAFFSLGLSIQFELFFVYLIPIFFILWLLFKLKFPDTKTFFLSVILFAVATSTMIATEIKFKFSGVMAIIGAGSNVGGGNNLFENVPKYAGRFFETFSQTLAPNISGLILGTFIIFFLTFLFIKDKEERKAILFIFIYLFSSSVMLLFGYHGPPWFLIGLAPAVILSSGFILSKFSNYFLVPLLVLLFVFNLNVKKELLEPDRSALLAKQLSVIDYTYESSDGKAFEINTVTNPLYINAIWAYHYDWYGKKYGYTPTWGGGDQLYPYDTLEKPSGEERFLYLIIDMTPRIPEVHRILARDWAEKQGKKVETKDFDGILVEKYFLK